MLGTTCILSADTQRMDLPDPFFFASVQMKRESVIDTNSLRLMMDVNPNYPYAVIKKDDYIIAMEGMIYNLSNAQLEQQLLVIATACHQPETANKLIRVFQESNHGEYIITIVNPAKNAVVVFNDFFGRLPLFFYHDHKTLIFTRDMKHILHLVPSIKIDRFGLTNYILFNYQLDSRTLFQGVSQFEYKQIVYATLVEQQVLVKIYKEELDLNLTSPYKDRKTCIQTLSEQLHESVRTCYNKASEKKYKIISDLSGGLDSRTIMGVLSKLTTDVDYICHQLQVKESEYAEGVFKAMDSPGRLKVVHVKDLASFDDNYLEQLVYQTNGLINFYTTSICTQTLEHVFLSDETFHKKTVRFGGLGFTDFMRKGYRIDNKTLLSSVEKGYPGPLTLNEACTISGINQKDYRDYFTALLDSWPEKKPEEQFKKLYFRYQIVLQSRYAEDRERVHFWNIQPMWNHRIIMEVLNRFPLKWRGHYMHTLLLNAVDPRLTSVPTNHVYVRFDDLDKLRKMEFKDNSILYIKLKKFLKGRKPVSKPQPANTAFSSLMTDNYKHLTRFKNVINIDNAISNYYSLGGDYNSITTLNIYLKTIESLYKSKIEN